MASRSVKTTQNEKDKSVHVETRIKGAPGFHSEFDIELTSHGTIGVRYSLKRGERLVSHPDMLFLTKAEMMSLHKAIELYRKENDLYPKWSDL